ncbi:protein gar2-like [Miscanthus floridulus]|uniref:protein gar2-like n=1 Tax=Miscanthus floridulus TaxID=154761 RepID=UPI00345B25D5
MVRKIAKMLKKLNKNSVKFDGKKKKFFTSSRRKPISKMDCYNYGDLSHHQCHKPKKDKYKKDDPSDDDDEKKKNKPYKKKEFYNKKKNGKAYIVGGWLMDIESSSGSSDDESENEKEKVATLVIGSSLSPPTPLPSSSTHLCLMAKGEQKVQNDDDSSGDDNASDDENENLDIDHDMALENEMLREENKRLKMEKNNDELREENKKLKLEKEHLKIGLSKFTRGQYLQSFIDTEEKKIESFKRGLGMKLMKTMANSKCATYNEFISDALT